MNCETLHFSYDCLPLINCVVFLTFVINKLLCPSRVKPDATVEQIKKAFSEVRKVQRHAENMHYWEHFRQAQPENSAEDSEKRKNRKMHLVGYCVLTMLISLCVHYFGFRKLEEVHNNFMDEDMLIIEIYNESKERDRVNGFKKQQEILRRKHTKFLERFKIHRGGEEK